VGNADNLILDLYLAGLQIPCAGATVTGQVQGSATAQIVIPDSDYGNHLAENTLVHLFYKTSRSDDLLLLFTGDLKQVSFTATSTARSLALVCFDHTHYFRQALMAFVRGKKTGGSGSWQKKMYNFLASTPVSLVNDKLGRYSPLKQVLELLKSHPLTKSRTATGKIEATLAAGGDAGIADGILSLLEAMGGVSPDIGSGKFKKGLNAFFENAEKRCKILQQMGVHPKDKTASLLLKMQAVKRTLKAVLAQRGKLMDFATIIDVLLPLIFHVRFPVVAPKFSPGLATTVTQTTWKKVKNKVGGSDSLSNFAASRVAKLEAVKAAILNKTVKESSAPEVLVAAYDTAKSAFKTYSTELKSDMVTFDGLKAKIKSSASMPDTSDTVLGAISGFLAEENTLQAVMLETTASGTDFVGVLKKVEDISDGKLNLFSQQHKKFLGNRKKLLFKIDELIKKYKSLKYAKYAKEVTEIDTTFMDRLFTTLFAPNVWFNPPPLCNVVFPDEYDSLKVDIPHSRMPSRLMLKTKPERYSSASGLPKLKSGEWMAPNILSGDKMKTLLKAATKDHSVLMEHERFGGVRPIYREFPDSSVFKDIDKTIFGANPTTEYMQRIAQFMFFDERLSMCQGMFNGPFQPRYVLGFPMLIVSRKLSNINTATANTIIEQGLEALEEELQGSNKDIPEQWLCVPQSITHEIAAEGRATTSVAFSYARTHRPSTYLGSDIIAAYKWDKISNNLKGASLIEYLLTLVNVYIKSGFSSKEDKKLEQLMANVQYAKASVEGVTTALVTGDPAAMDDTSGAQIRKASEKFRAATITFDKGFKDLVSASKLWAPKKETASDANMWSALNAATQGAKALGELAQNTFGGKSGEASIYKKVREAVMSDPVVANSASLATVQQGLEFVIEAHKYIWSHITKNQFWVTPQTKAIEANKLQYKQIVADKKVVYSKLLSAKALLEKVSKDKYTKNFDKEIKVNPDELLRPPWLDPIYSVESVGDEVYQHWLGCSSIVDFMMNSQTVSGIGQTLMSEATQGGWASSLLKKTSSQGFNVLGGIISEITVENAVDIIVAWYIRQKSALVGASGSIHDIIAAVTNRPVATFDDIFDTGGFHANSVTQTGFFITSESALKNIESLLDDDKLTDLPLSEIASDADVRKEMHDRVYALFKDLIYNRYSRG